jgi:hypothetical protein
VRATRHRPKQWDSEYGDAEKRPSVRHF